MKRKIISIFLLVVFLVSLFPAALAQEDTELEGVNTALTEYTELETEDESELQSIDNIDCWSDKPDYRPGFDKGFFIWQGDCGKFWWLDWSGDTRAKWKKWYKLVYNTEPTTEEPTSEEVSALENAAAAIDTNSLTTEEVSELQEAGEITSAAIADRLRNAVGVSNTAVAVKKLQIKRPKLMYKVSGKITSNGQIFDVGVRKFDKRDKIQFRSYKNVIVFSGWVGPHFDGIFFRTTGDKVTFDLTFDGKKRTDIIYIGKAKRNPDSNPFTLGGDPATRRACPVNTLIYNQKCVNRLGDVAVTSEGISGDLSSGEKPTVEPSVRSTSQGIDKEKAIAISAKQYITKARKVDKAIVKRYVAAKNEFIKARQLQQNARTKFTNAKAKWTECEDSETEDCKQVKNNIKTGSKNFLGNSADAIIRHLERIKAKIEGSENLTDEEVEEILAEIDAKIAELEALKEKAEAAETKEEIREAAQEIRDAWKPIRNRAIYWAARLTNAKMGFITGKMVQLENRLEKTVEKMETNGKDVSEIEPLLEEFHSLLVSAKENHEAGVEAWKEFKESGEQAQHAEAKRLMNQARKDAVEAHKVLKQIVREIKEAKGTQEFAETEDEVEEEDEEEE